MQLPLFLKRFKRTNRAAGWVCLATNARGAYVVQLKRTAQRIQVKRCSFYAIENITHSALDKLVKELHLSDLQFTTLLAPEDYQIIMVDAPNVPADEIKIAIRYRIKDSINYSVDQATVDVLQIPNNNRQQSVYAVVASNDTIKKRMELFEKAEIELTVIDIPETAQRNIAALFETEGRGLALLAFDERGGLLTFTCDQELCLSRRLEITSGQLQDANLSLRQQFIDRVELEVQRSLDYFDRQFHQVSLNKMLVSAPTSAGLVSMLADNLGMPVEALDLSQVFDIKDVPALEENEFIIDALPAIGAALRQESRQP
jgi:MSHA biogenesis protein MshI